ncbi:carbohydrate ABC transporter permease [Streptomyces sp. NBC_00878]|uniref:carbohydrate ABC transporter permease n=1 Tax=Streptomyces sp. NBC_00878 TaxID=2975854 RepID=UPI0022522BD5|nr:sugar ABC transporter permease [Streptomyces sp. NBC_00878]MCX4903746.1 sugar ABC transporter permease [Streptomyces sp. NBC_00878]
MAAPALLLFGLFGLVPLGGVVVLSLTRWDGLGSIGWEGIGNWSSVLTDGATWQALGLTVKVMLVSWLVQTPIALALGVFQAPRGRLRALFAVLFFLPLLLSAVAIGLTWQALLDPSFGIGATPGLHWLAKPLLGSPDLALYTVIFVIAWQFIPFHALLYQAGIRQIPTALYEAAALDGAGPVSRFRHITLPQLKYTMVTSSTLMLVGSLTYFDLIFVLSGGNGGPGDSTRVLPLAMYITGFQAHDMGRASAVATLLVVFGLGLSMLTTRLSGFTRMDSQQEGM